MSNLKKYFLILTVGFLLVLIPVSVLAQTDLPTLGGLGSSFGGLTLTQLIVRILQIFFGIVGVIFLGLLLYAGFLWMTSQGEVEKITKAKKMITAGVIGMVLIFSAFGIASFLYNALGGGGGAVSEPCDPTIDSIDSCNTTDGCAGTRQCVDGYWTACQKLDPNCPNSGFYGNKYANIFRFTDDNLPNWSGWTIGYTNSFRGVVNLPKSASLNVFAYAHNQIEYGNISGMNFWVGENQDPIIFSNLSTSNITINNRSYHSASSSVIWNASGITENDTSVRVSVDNNSSNDFSSNNLRIKFRPDHCFNGIKDGNETDIDCGGDCGNCAGDSCRGDTNNTCADENCASGICGSQCVCLANPSIAYIDPAFDVLEDTDWRRFTPSTTDDDISNGAIGNYITIFGKNFGTTTGQVYFVDRNNENQTLAGTALCVNSWSKNMIIAMVPTELSRVAVEEESEISEGGFNYDVFVATADNLVSNNWPFQVNYIERPGICAVEPASGAGGRVIEISGWNFPQSEPRNVVWWLNNLRITSTTSTAWSTDSVNDVVISGVSGRAGISIYNGSTYSNLYPFNISAGASGDPCGGHNITNCSDDTTTCNTGLRCVLENNDCVCRPSDGSTACVAGETRQCFVGGCAGIETCSTNGVWGACQPNDGCVPFLGNNSLQSIFTWLFLAQKNFGPGMSCSSVLWGDGSCDINGCGGNNLACDFSSSTQEFIEIYNPTNDNISLDNWGLVYGTNNIPTDGLVAWFKLDNNLVDLKNSTYPLSQIVPETSDWSYLTTSSCPNFDCLQSRNVRFGSDQRNQEINNSSVGNFTWSLWFKPGSNGRNFTDVLFKGDQGDSPTTVNRAISLSWNHANSELIFKWDSQRLSGRTGWPKNKWYHIVLTFDNVSKNAVLYVNGSRVSGMRINSNNKYTNREIKFGPNNSTDYDVFDEVMIYNKTLSALEIKTLFDYRGRRLEGIINSKSVAFIEGDLGSELYLPQNRGFINLVQDNNIVDSIGYGGNLLSPAYYPGSMGKRNDGTDNNNNNDFVYYSANSKGLVNNQRGVRENNSLQINEFSLTHEPCTCVPRSQLCQPGSIDNQSCPPVGQCRQVRVCDQFGSYGACQQADPNCVPYPIVPASTLSIFTWSFNTNNNSSNDPYIIVDCSRFQNCDLEQELPSPSPWGGWNADDYPALHIDDSEACVNAQLMARFSETMNSADITTDNIKLYKQNGNNFDEVSLTGDDDIELIDNRLLTISPSSSLDADSQYLVWISKNVRDELGRNISDKYRGAYADKGFGETVCESATENPGVCWTFETRDDNTLCDVGCVDCYPDKYYGYYFGHIKQHLGAPISEDNVCLALNGKNYQWNWSVEDRGYYDNQGVYIPRSDSEDGWFIVNISNYESLFESLYAWFPYPWIPPIISTAITTAIRESGFYNVALENRFGTEDDYYFRVSAQEEESSATGYCRAHNDFTNPIVIENSFCRDDVNPAKRIIQSPSPWKNSQDACPNANIVALFSRNMYNNSLNEDNILVYKCDDQASALSSTSTSGCNPKNIDSIDIFEVSRPNITFEDLISEDISNNSSSEAVSISIRGGLEEDEWYKVIIRGGSTGVRGAKFNDAAEYAEGFLQIPNSNARYGQTPDYYWYFKTASQDCAINYINVNPSIARIPLVSGTKNYLSDPTALNCNHLNPAGYKWVWGGFGSEASTDDIQTNNSNNIGEELINICSTSNETCLAEQSIQGDVSNLFNVKVFSKNEGQLKIKARATTENNNTIRDEDKFGLADLLIGDPEFRVTSVSADSLCVNPDVLVRFNQRVNTDANNLSKIKIYQCASFYEDLSSINGNCVVSGGPINITPTASGNTVAFANHTFTKGKTYKVIIEGGDTGFISQLNRPLATTTLNTDINDDNINDSYVAHFNVLDDAVVCGGGWATNPCPNGVWSYTAGGNETKLTMTLYRGQDNAGSGCIADSNFNQISFWRRVLNYFANIVKRFFGLHGAIASNFWCPIATSEFSAGDLSQMRLGNYRRDLTISGVAGSEVIGYTQENNNYELKIINKNNWSANREYLAVMAYEKFDGAIVGTSTGKYNIRNGVCVPDDVQVDVWPRGAQKEMGAFFCYSDRTGSGASVDDCGRLTENPYDDDMSSAWTRNQPSNGYNLYTNGDTQSGNYKKGNQQLYRLWLLSSLGNNKYPLALRPTTTGATWNFTSNIVNLNKSNVGGNALTAIDSITNTNYPGDFWLTAGNVQGWDRLRIMFGESASNLSEFNFPILTYFCNNIWPTPDKFPFMDSTNPSFCQSSDSISNNCQNINTNFGTYYCRDFGDKSTTSDDLPDLGDKILASTTGGSLKEFIFTALEGESVGVRVYPNPNHLAPDAWYRQRFNNNSASLSELIVDGNKAVREGRTVYVNAPDKSGDKLYTNIYLMSYAEGGEQIENIFSQLIGNWFFNAGSEATDGFYSAGGVCDGDTNTADLCLTDADCLKRGKNFCSSDKAKITRDAIRLSDLNYISSTLDTYHNIKRCSNDFNRLCQGPADCYGGGSCGNFYPNLMSGTYVTTKSFSVWPSWQDNLAKSLGMSKLPTDPVNRFENCSNPYNPITCWNENNKTMNCEVGPNSLVYYYYGVQNGESVKVLAGNEFALSDSLDWANANTNILFDTYATQRADAGFCSSNLITCGNGTIDAGEDCATCPFDAGCPRGRFCDRGECKTWEDMIGDNCGDGVFNPLLEECDCGDSDIWLTNIPLRESLRIIFNCNMPNGEVGANCTEDCYCGIGRTCSGGVILPSCGDNYFDFNIEQCDYVEGVPSCGAPVWVNDQFLPCCNPATCQLRNEITNPIFDIFCSPDATAGSCANIDCPEGTDEVEPCSVRGDNTCWKKCQERPVFVFCSEGESDNPNCQGGSIPDECPPCTIRSESCFFDEQTGCSLAQCVPDTDNPECICGNRLINLVGGVGEECDCGNLSLDEIFMSGANPFTCYSQNGVNPNLWRPTGGQYQYCGENCTNQTSDYGYCGDGVVNLSCLLREGGVCSNILRGCDGMGGQTCEVCDNGNDDDCNDDCDESVDPDGDCENGCCWSPGDGVCEPECGETHTPNTCDDCAPCHNGQAHSAGNYSDDACCNSQCNWQSSGWPAISSNGCGTNYSSDKFDDSYYCGDINTTNGSGNLNCAGATWSWNWDGNWRYNTGDGWGCAEKQYQEKTCSIGSVSDPKCNAYRPSVINTYNEHDYFRIVSKDDDSKCCRLNTGDAGHGHWWNEAQNNENFTNENDCELLSTDAYLLRSCDTIAGSHWWVFMVDTNDNDIVKISTSSAGFIYSLQFKFSSVNRSYHSGNKMKNNASLPSEFNGYYHSMVSGTMPRNKVVRGTKIYPYFYWNDPNRNTPKYWDFHTPNETIKENTTQTGDGCVIICSHTGPDGCSLPSH